MLLRKQCISRSFYVAVSGTYRFLEILNDSAFSNTVLYVFSLRGLVIYFYFRGETLLNGFKLGLDSSVTDNGGD